MSEHMTVRQHADDEFDRARELAEAVVRAAEACADKDECESAYLAAKQEYERAMGAHKAANDELAAALRAQGVRL